MNWTRIALHLLFWVVYLPLNAIVNCNLNRLPIDEAFWEALGGEAFSLPVKLLLVYFIFYYIIPLYSERSKVGKLIGLMLLSFVFTTFLYRISVVYIYFPFFRPDITDIDFFNAKALTLTAFDLFITLAAAIPVKLIRVHYKSLEFEQELIREKLQSELSFLPQTNPHFLFNTLNNLFVLARKKSDSTPDAIMMLSKIMRFMLHDCLAPRIPVSNEARVIRDYIELERLRYSDRLVVDYQEDIDNLGAQIAPLLLLPFVENSFKHGASSTTGKVMIQVRLQLHEHQLQFMVQNTIDTDAPKPVKSGIGLNNVQRQLELIYPGKYELIYGPQADTYQAVLNINLADSDL